MKSKQWLQDNFWNLLITFVTVIIAWTSMNNKISFLEIRAQSNYDRITNIEELLKKIPDREYLDLKIDPIYADLQEVKKDVKAHLQQTANNK